jgi:predicted O-methyltransferase YrrM
MRKIAIVKKYLSHFFTAKSRFSIHSPFILNFIDNVLISKIYNRKIIEIELLRNLLLNNNNEIEVIDYGTGSEKNSERYSISIKCIAKNHLKSKKEAQILYNLVNYYNPENILELGTSLGITTLYISVSNPKSIIITIEGSTETAKIAKDNFERLNATNITSLVGRIEDNLDLAMELLQHKPYMLFFDANHKKVPTLDYFRKCMEYSHEKSIFVFDDIYFSDEMSEAWDEIKNHERVTLSIDIFKMGIIFFDKSIAKRNVKLRI